MQLCGPAGTLVALGFDLAFSVKFYILNNYIFVKIKILLIIVNYVRQSFMFCYYYNFKFFNI